jgi:hypothetical protein
MKMNINNRMVRFIIDNRRKKKKRIHKDYLNELYVSSVSFNEKFVLLYDSIDQ